ncbi:amidohydrolase family protein [Sphingomonas lutea]|uniref:Amidohydrolase family protein n=1 Tax=Sphingomonas lutea TaxID=1045317 RepID=A0A7G9SHE3_9SPHN|nr:amidohydrolase [Sphingomonas lutea]QNN67268.1 amidohydrolase family protein [Sphingomonas lutea]
MNRALIALAAAFFSTTAYADTLVTNVQGVQVGADGQLERFSGLVIGRDGKVRTVLTGPPPPMAFESTIDGKGHTLLPGLIDAHGHVMGLGTAAIQLDLVGTTSLQDLQARLRGHAAANPKDPWIIGRGWNQELWPDKRFPIAADLDAMVADRPVVLERVDGHAVIVNSAALRAAGITSATADPTGGKIERGADGAPTGLLVDAAASLVKTPPLTAEQRRQALAKAQEALLSVGVTAAADMGTSRDDWALFFAAGGAKTLNLRIMAYAFGLENSPSAPTPWLFSDRLQMGGVKLYDDGALGSRGAWLKQPYADKPDTRGLQFLTDKQISDQANEAARRGFQLAIHAIGDAANAQVITTYERLAKTYGRDGRWRIEHFQIADPRDIGRLAPAGIIASMQPTHQTSDRTMAEARLGPNRLAGAYAWQTVLKSGAKLAFGSDFPVESPNPFPGLAAAISREDMNGQPPGGWIPAEKLTFAQALHAFTRGAAYAGFAESKIGALEPGRWADFIIVNRDVSTVDAQALARTQVLQTWVAGKKVWERPASGERGD